MSYRGVSATSPVRSMLAPSEFPSLTPIKRLKGKRRQPVATDGTFNEYVQQLVNTGIVKDILIEAQRLPDSAGVKGMHLCTREGYADLD